MKAFLALLLFLSQTTALVTPCIIGGTEVPIEAHPYQIALLYGGARTCGGSILSPAHIITAAHCVASAAPSRLRIRAGSALCDAGGIVVSVAAIAIHPNYSAPTVDNDLAVLTLSRNLTFGPKIAPVGLPAVGADTLVPGAEVVVSGWGATGEGAANSPSLRAVTVSVVGREECRAEYRGFGPVTDSMFCAGTPAGGRNACGGDSGGPAAARGVLVGVVSWGHGCGRKGFPGVYASTSFLRGFIGRVTGL
ncbi:serine protease [Aspergillus aculeatinus CBS 121060]|uniref:Trypsin-like serine protease n=1 Tax=Aspergillus aculeatinus CBS 121060 TaxID=1448322 RepID=A0ACD1HMF3_9EURO|nr:trypsin-like serine protease [Aspergillus aculeatinus CBS 121060]RAH74691.1 trypsin-like serine protease [Aspergillus aculeatinus CBS 121060]